MPRTRIANGYVVTVDGARNVFPGGFVAVDGHRIAATNKLMYANMAYDPDRAFAPIVLIGASPLIIATWPDAPYKLLAGLITFAKANAFVASEKSRALMQTIGVAPVGGTAAALKAHIAAEVAKLAPIIKAADIRF